MLTFIWNKLVITFQNMKLWKEDLETFKAIYKNKFWVNIPDNKAVEYATALLNLTKLILK